MWILFKILAGLDKKMTAKIMHIIKMNGLEYNFDLTIYYFPLKTGSLFSKKLLIAS